MKKIKCEVSKDDYIHVVPDFDGADIKILESGFLKSVYLNPAKIRKLRKQLKRALVEIEGNNAKESKSCGCDQCVERTKDEEDDWFSVGKEVKIVKRLHGHGFKIGQIVKHAGKTPAGNEKLESLDDKTWYAVSKSECMPA